jgi:hypothetical protein
MKKKIITSDNHAENMAGRLGRNKSQALITFCRMSAFGICRALLVGVKQVFHGSH